MDFDPVRIALQDKARSINLTGEIKWNKVTANYLEKYVAVMDLFFDFVRRDKIKYRLMFTQNRFVPKGLTREQRENGYFLLYYQFIKHAFGLKYANPTHAPIHLRIYFDRFPDTKEKIARFRSYIVGLQHAPEFRRARIRISPEQVAEIDSHDHILLQCLDVVTGSMQFRLNDLHKATIPGENRRGKRTIAKEDLYKHMLSRIWEFYPHFNIGISTGTQGDIKNRWAHPYRHWCFIPKDFVVDESKSKN